MAGPCSKCPASVRSSRNRPHSEGDYHSGGAAPGRREARHSPPDRNRGRHRADDACRAWPRCPVHGGDAARHGSRRSAGPPGPGVRAFRHSAWTADDGDAA